MRREDKKVIEHVIDQPLIDEMSDILRGKPEDYDMYRVQAAMKRALDEITGQAGVSLASGCKLEEIKRRREELSRIVASKQLNKECQEVINKYAIENQHMGIESCLEK